jgi:hypothetical protein
VIAVNAALSNHRWTGRGGIGNFANNKAVITAGSLDQGVQVSPRTIGLALDLRF